MSSFTNAYAVVVGIAAYDPANRLPHSVLNDACDIADVLRDPRLCGYDPSRVVRLLDADATRASLQTALREAATRCDEESTFIFYVSSHGARIESGPHRGEYLIPVDAAFDDAATLAQTALSGIQLSQLFNAIHASRLVGIFDCCHSAGVAQLKAASRPPVKRGLSQQCYAQLAAGRGRVIFASCRESESSYVFDRERNRVFTKHLLEGLRGGVPGPGGIIRVFDLFHYVQPKVAEEVRSKQGESEAQQHPVFKCSVEENFPIALHTAGKGTVAPSPEEKACTYDAYVSYAPADEDWVGGTLLPYLQQRALKVVTQDSETSSIGGFRVENSAQGIERAKRTIVVLSPEYLKDKFSVLETLVATHMGVRQAQSRLVPLVYRPCPTLPLLLDALVGIDFARLGQERGLERAAAAVAGPVPAMAFS